jgi:hypothetical protein
MLEHPKPPSDAIIAANFAFLGNIYRFIQFVFELRRNLVDWPGDSPSRRAMVTTGRDP